MSFATVEKAILREVREMLNNPQLKMDNVMEWSTSPLKPQAGEVCFKLPRAGVFVAVKQ